MELLPISVDDKNYFKIRGGARPRLLGRAGLCINNLVVYIQTVRKRRGNNPGHLNKIEVMVKTPYILIIIFR